MMPRNKNDEPLYIFVDIIPRDDRHEAIVDPESDDTMWCEAAALCLAVDYEDEQGDGCHRLACHDGQHAYQDGDLMIQFHECACWKTFPNMECWHNPAFAATTTARLYVEGKEEAWTSQAGQSASSASSGR